MHKWALFVRARARARMRMRKWCAHAQPSSFFLLLLLGAVAKPVVANPKKEDSVGLDWKRIFLGSSPCLVSPSFGFYLLLLTIVGVITLGQFHNFRVALLPGFLDSIFIRKSSRNNSLFSYENETSNMYLWFLPRSGPIQGRPLERSFRYYSRVLR